MREPLILSRIESKEKLVLPIYLENEKELMPLIGNT